MYGGKGAKSSAKQNARANTPATAAAAAAAAAAASTDVDVDDECELRLRPWEAGRFARAPHDAVWRANTTHTRQFEKSTRSDDDDDDA